MKRKGFKTSPSIRIPRASAEKMHAAAAAADSARAGLRDAVALIDELNKMPLQPPPRLTGAQIKRLEAIRLLSLGV